MEDGHWPGRSDEALTDFCNLSLHTCKVLHSMAYPYAVCRSCIHCTWSCFSVLSRVPTLFPISPPHPTFFPITTVDTARQAVLAISSSFIHFSTCHSSDLALCWRHCRSFSSVVLTAIPFALCIIASTDRPIFDEVVISSCLIQHTFISSTELILKAPAETRAKRAMNQAGFV